MHKISATEGDVNSSKLRKSWQEQNLASESLQLLEQDAAIFLHQSMSTPCLDTVVSCEGAYITNSDGKRILDFHGNSVHQVGHANPEVIHAVCKQMTTLAFSPRRYTNATAVLLGQMLLDEMHSNQSYRVLYTTSGTASIGLALKLARRATGRHKIVSLWDSFHGASLDAISIGGEAAFRAGIGPLLPGCEHIMPYNSYRCMFGSCSQCQLKCLDYLDYILSRETDVAAVVMETVRSTDVQIPPKEYYAKLRTICDRHQALLILDEIPTALGRTGTMYAYQNYDIEPDILVLGKGLGGGIIPFSAILAKDSLNVCGDISLGHYTHEKSPLGSAAAIATIKYIHENKLLDHVKKISDIFEMLLRELKEAFYVVGDVRVIGLMGAVELITDPASKEKNSELAEEMLYFCLEQGLSFKVSQGNVLTLMPPLIITEAEIRWAVEIIRQGLKKFVNIEKP